MSRRKATWRLSPRVLGTLLVLAFVAAGCGRSHQFNGTAYEPPQPAPAITGINWDGRTFNLSDLKGKVTLVFFGYTHCPDVCPLTLAELADLVKTLGDQRQDVAVVFVTTDPERDTQERLAEYVPVFDPAFYGVYVAPADQETVKKGYGAYAAKVVDDKQADATQYFVEHSGYIYLIDREGNLRVAFGYSEPKDKLLRDVEYLLSG
jgi:protein SCO1